MSITHSSVRGSFVRVRGDRARAAVRSHTRVATAACRAALIVTIAAVLIGRLDNVMVPHDDGTIGQTAERVLQGELPHRDFDDPYTGLLSVVNAASFRLLGVSMRSARIVLLAATLVSFLALFGVCRRVLPDWVAALTTAAAFLASVPNYFSPMPTWYNLYCTIFAIVAMLHYYDTRRLRWVAVAGACVGISFLFKLVGIYFAAAAALFVIFVEQQRADARPVAMSASRDYWYLLTMTGLGAYVALVATFVATLPNLPEFTVFFGPSAVMAGFLAWNEWRLRSHAARERFCRLLVIGATFFGGLAVMVGLYLLPYVAAGEVSSWFHGVFVSPLRRLTLVDESLAAKPFLIGSVLIAALALVIGLARKFEQAANWAGWFVACAVLAWGMACEQPLGYSAVWSAARLMPLAASVGLSLCLWFTLRQPHARHGAKAGHAMPHAAETFLLVATAGVFSLVQFPLSHGIYFLYVAPLVVVAGALTLALIFPAPAVSVLAGRIRTRKSVAEQWAGVLHSLRVGMPVAVVIFAVSVVAFSMYWVLPGYPLTFGDFYVPAERTARIEGARCPLRCDDCTAQKYSPLIEQVARHSRQGSAILALPDAPEVYFLTGRRNPTRTFFDVFDADYGTPQRDQRLLDTIERQQIDVVVLRNRVEFSLAGASPAFQREIASRFPHSKQILVGPRRIASFTVFWRDHRQQRPSMPLAEVAHR